MLIQLLDDFIARDETRVLDIGAGQVVAKNRRAGYHDLANKYARLIDKGRYIGLEIDTESRPAVVGDAHRLPFADCSFDGVLMASVLEHLYDPIRAVDQVYRVLKPGGVFFSYAPFYHPYHASPHDYYRFTADGYRYLLRDFRQVQLVSGGDYIAVLNDVLDYPLKRAGRVGRALSTVFVQFPLGLLLRLRGEHAGDKLAVGYGAWAVK